MGQIPTAGAFVWITGSKKKANAPWNRDKGFLVLQDVSWLYLACLGVGSC